MCDVIHDENHLHERYGICLEQYPERRHHMLADLHYWYILDAQSVVLHNQCWHSHSWEKK